jgi:hypothetical protein
MGNQSISFFNKIFEINERKNKIKITANKIAFLGDRFQADYLYEKHFINVYRVFDHSKNQYKNLKVIHINNDKVVNNTIIKDLKEKYIYINHPGIINIQEIYLDDFLSTGTRNKNYINLILVEEAIDYITIKDFLIILIEEFSKEDVGGVFSNEILENIFINLILIIETLQKFQIFNFNMNFFNVVICKNKNNKFEIKFSDFEIPHVINLNLKVSLQIKCFYF